LAFQLKLCVWADAGKLKFERSPTGHRRFYLTDIKRITPRDFNQLEDRITINFAHWLLKFFLRLKSKRFRVRDKLDILTSIFVCSFIAA